MLQTFRSDINTFYVEGGALLLLPTKAYWYDAKTYPESEFVVFLNTDNPDVTRQLIQHIPKGVNLIFKLIKAHDQIVLVEYYSLTRIIGFESYTASKASTAQAWPDVVITDQLDHRLVPLFAENGYGPETLERYLNKNQGLTFSIFQAENPVATCLAFLNYGQVWEIGGLYTIPDARRQGLGKRIVETGVKTLLDHNYVLRYQMHEENIPSMRLAEAIGLDHFLTVTHFKSYP